MLVLVFEFAMRSFETLQTIAIFSHASARKAPPPPPPKKTVNFEMLGSVHHYDGTVRRRRHVRKLTIATPAIQTKTLAVVLVAKVYRFLFAILASWIHA